MLSDEIYAQIYFTERPPLSLYSLPGMAERTILLDGFSKAYAMTGWRLGFGVFPQPLVQPIRTLMVNTHSCLPLFIQDAGVEALNGPQDCVAHLRQTFRERRDLVINLLSQIPNITFTVPQGAFYVLINISQLGNGDATTVANQLLDAGVALQPADSFGSGGKGYLRLAFTQSKPVLKEALTRFAAIAKTI